MSSGRGANAGSYANGEAHDASLLHAGARLLAAGDYRGALAAYRSALAAAERAGDQHVIASACEHLGALTSDSGDYVPAIDYYLRALSFFEELDDASSTARVLHSLGYVYGQCGDLDVACDYLLQALDAFHAVGDLEHEARALTNLGVIYSSRDEPARAMECALRAQMVFQALGDLQGTAAALINVGEISMRLRNADMARVHFTRALSLLREQPIAELQVRAMMNIGRLCAEGDDLSEALVILDQALAIALEGNLIAAAFQIHEDLAGIHEVFGDHRAALEHHRSYVRLMREHAGLQNQKAIAELRLRFDLERALKDEEIRRRNEVMQAVVRTQEEERRRIAGDLHDGVGQLLASAKINLQRLDSGPDNLTPTDRDALARSMVALDRACTDVRTIAHSLASSTLEELGLAAAVREIVDGVASESGPAFHLELDGPSDDLPEYAALVLYRIAQELIANILKHAGASNVYIELLRRGDRVLLMVQDDGRGFDPAHGGHVGMGRRNIETRARTANGIVAFDSRPGHGTTVTVEIPLLP